MLIVSEGVPVVQANVFSDLPWMRHGFGLRDIPLSTYLDSFRVSDAVTPQTRQIHSATVHLLNKSDHPVLEGDAFVTREPGRVCVVRTADCVPILLADPDNRAVAAIHAGWRGSAARIVEKTFETMQKNFGTQPEQLRVAIGPAIGGPCYAVGAEVAAAFGEAGISGGGWIDDYGRNKWNLDLAYANRHVLARLGVRSEHVYLSLACTHCDPEKFSSYRREGNARGEQVSFVVIV